jgi:hypothetical protein
VLVMDIPRSIYFGRASMHTYTISLRLTGKNLDVEEITSRLGLPPTNSWRIGDLYAEGRVRGTSMWEHEVRPQSGNPEWVSLEEGLLVLLSLLKDCMVPLRDLQRELDVCLWCGHFSSSFDGGPTLSPTLLKLLADLGVELVLDTHTVAPDFRVGVGR